ncbi:MAG: hopanoid biosynthesis-associated protein HpnK [Vulcanimicrobiaceae bacterium]
MIVTADDFGLSIAVNEAIERAHREGILTATSLMVSADGTDDAIARAHRLPSLGVGLHVVVVNGRPVLPPEEVPDLVYPGGAFGSDLLAAGLRYFFNPNARRQLEAEIRAQFEAFAKTGLPLDHVNAQNHMHVHPTVFSTILRVGRDFGMTAVRIPYEPFWPSWRSAHRDLGVRLGNAVLLAPWLTLMRQQLRRAGLMHNDAVFGLNDTGHMSAERVRALLDELPGGVTEMYFHPDLGNVELAALCDPAVIAAVRQPEIASINFGMLSAGVA